MHRRSSDAVLTMNADEPRRLSLQERTKSETRREISKLVWPVFAARGFDAVSVAEAAHIAGISRASFFRFFESKEDSVLAAADPIAAQVAVLISDGGSSFSWDALRAACTRAGAVYLDNPDESIERLRLIRSSPSLRAYDLERENRCQTSLLKAFGERSEQEVRSIAVCVTAALAVLDCATSAWVESGGSTELLSLIEDGFGALAANIRDERE